MKNQLDFIETPLATPLYASSINHSWVQWQASWRRWRFQKRKQAAQLTSKECDDVLQQS